MLDYHFRYHTDYYCIERGSPLSTSSDLSRSLNDIDMEELFDPTDNVSPPVTTATSPATASKPSCIETEHTNGHTTSTDKDPDLEKLIDRMLEIQSLPGYSGAASAGATSTSSTTQQPTTSHYSAMATPSWHLEASQPQSVLEYKPVQVKQEPGTKPIPEFGFICQPMSADYYAQAAGYASHLGLGVHLPTTRNPSFATHAGAMRAYSSPEEQFAAAPTPMYLSHAHSMSTLDPSHSKMVITGTPSMTPSSRRSSHGSSSGGTPSPGQPMSPFQSAGALRFSVDSSLPTDPNEPLDADKLCTVCGDKAACQHYGARTCEGCKGFFKRTVQKKAQYVCQGNRNCLIDKQYRNRCQYCRYQKCMAVGMVKEVVRCGSLQGRRGRLPSKTKSQSSDDPPSPPMPLITSISRAYTETRPSETVLKMDWSSQVTTEQMLNLIDESVEVINAWASRLPGFSESPLHDRETLVRTNIFNVITARLAYRSLETAPNEQVCFETGVLIPLHQCPELWQSWLSSVLKLAVQFKQHLDIDLQSYSCLCAIVLLSTNEMVHLEDVNCRDKLHQSIINTLKDHCTLQTTKHQYFAKIIAAYQDIEAIGPLGQQALASCRNWNYALPSNIQQMLSPV